MEEGKEEGEKKREEGERSKRKGEITPRLCEIAELQRVLKAAREKKGYLQITISLTADITATTRRTRKQWINTEIIIRIAHPANSSFWNKLQGPQKLRVTL